LRKLLLLIFLFAVLLGCVQDEDELKSETNVSEEKLLTIKEIAEEIKKNPEEFLSPYDGFSYDTVDIIVENNKITVRAISKDLPGEDFYLFVYENGTLTLKSYLLEAIPLSVREKAISVALSNETIYENANGYVTVRRVLPHTAAKFYLPKELFSVTWHGDRMVSALVDLEEGKVVRIYISE